MVRDLSHQLAVAAVTRPVITAPLKSIGDRTNCEARSGRLLHAGLVPTVGNVKLSAVPGGRIRNRKIP
jgi:hypothetical protein